MPRTTRRLTLHTALTVPPARLTLHHREYLTAPAVLVVEGVLNGGLIPGSELVAHDWNSVPIVINHPLDAQGQPMSARTPEILAVSGVGQLYHARLGTGQRQGHTVTSLQAELWLDIADVQAVGGEAVQAMEMLEAQHPLELSTGFYSQAEATRGTFYGVPYSEIHHDLRPDHLALLPNGIGACDWQSGCGSPRLNQPCTCHQEAPMDQATARGLERVVQLIKTFGQRDHPVPQSPPTIMINGAVAVFLNGYYVGDGTNTQVCALARQLPTPPLRTNQTDADTREALYGALAREMSVDFTPIFIDAVDMANQTFTYRQGERLMQRSWTIENDQIVLTDGAQDVQRHTTYTPVTQEQEDPMPPSAAVKARVTALITNDQTPWGDADRAQLEGMSEEQLQRLSPTPSAPAPATIDDALATLPTHLRESVGQMAREHDTRKQAAITALVAARYPLSADRLTALDLDELERLVPLAVEPGTSYAGQGLPHVRPQVPDEESWQPLSILSKKEPTSGSK